MQVAFEGEIILIQYYAENKRLDACLRKYKLAIEVDECDHEGRGPNSEQSRQLMIEGHGITVVRTNPETTNCIKGLIYQIYMHIIKSTKKQTEKSTKKSLIDDLSKKLLEIEFNSNRSIKSKCLKWIVKKILPDYKEWKTQSEKKTKKAWKKIWNKVLFRV